MREFGGREMFIFDCHVHVGSNDKMRSFGVDIKDFTGPELIERMDSVGVDRSLIFPVANPHTNYETDNTRIVQWAKEYPDRLVPFMRINPWFIDEARETVARFAAMGARGIKFHSRIDGAYEINDPYLIHPVIEEAEKHNLVILMHTGEVYTSHPGLLADLCMDFPNTTFICGHMGMLDGFGTAVAFAKRLDNMLLDTTDHWPPTLITKAVRAVGPEKVIFGSDTPYLPVAAELEKVALHSELTPDELELILGGNLNRVFGFDT